MGETDASILDRIRSWARHHASGRTTRDHSSPIPSTLPTTNEIASEKRNGHRSSPRSASGRRTSTNGRSRDLDDIHNNATSDDISPVTPPAAPPPVKSEAEGTTDSAIGPKKMKPKLGLRMKYGIIRFGQHTKEALFHSWVNVLLIFVPVGIVVEALGLNPAVVFAMNAVAIIPLAALLTHATEGLAARVGDTLGALINVSFGNAVELIIFIIALVKDEISIVQASLVGSILSNLLLILGMAFLFGGLRYQEQIYNSTVTQMSACLLSLSVTSLLLPTAFHASFSDNADADDKTLKVSRGTSVVLLIVYILYLLFQLKSHAYMYESTPQHIIDEESHPGILADMLDSSSSSSDSDTSSSSDTDTSGSHTTTKRIKRAFRNRRRRKSSISSINTMSVPSVVSSPSTERASGILDVPPVQNGSSRRTSALGAIASGDEADDDGDAGLHGDAQPRVRDFVESVKEEVAKEKEQRKRKKHKKHHKRRHYSKKEEETEASSSNSHKHDKKAAKEDGNHGPQVGFSDDVQVAEIRTDPAPKKSFGIRQLQPRPSLRPTLPKMLSQNVFVSQSPSTTAASGQNLPTTVRTGSGTIRRTNSLPDRLNRQATPSGPRDAIPPYARASSTRVRSMRSDGDDWSEDEEKEKEPMSLTVAAVLLLISTALVAVCAEFLVDAIPGMIAQTPVSQAFIGLIILPIVSNAAEHITAVTVATKNKMDLAIGVAVGSSIQIAIFVTPLVVILGWCLSKDMSLYFNLFQTISLFVTAFVVNFLVLDGRSNYLEGSLLIAAYIIIAVAAFFYPDSTAQSSLGGGVA